MEKPAEGFGKFESEWIDEITEEHVGVVLKYHDVSDLPEDSTFSYYMRVLLVKKGKFWFEYKGTLQSETWTVSDSAYNCARGDYKSLQLLPHEIDPKLHIVEDDIDRIFSCYSAQGGRHLYHLKILHVYDDMFWCGQWDTGTKRWKIEKKVRLNADANVIYEEEEAVSWAILEASPWSKTEYKTKCPTCGAAWCNSCSTDEEHVCCACSKSVDKE